MSGSASIGLEQAILGHTLGFSPMAVPSHVYVALCFAATVPSETVRGIEPLVAGYVRMPATFALIADASNAAANTTSIEWPAATSDWGTLGYFELWDAPTGGSRLYWGQFSPPDPVTVAAGDIVRFSAGTLGVQASTGTGGTTSIGAYLPLAGGVMSGAITLAADPTDYLQAATKQYVDAHSGTGGGPGFLPLSGGAMLGTLTLAGNATLPLHAVPLQQFSAATVTATGSTAPRSLADRFAEAYNLKDFGALSDGSTNDATALNAAIAAIIALPHGGKLILPAGRTIIASAIVASIPAGKTLTIEGMGPRASELFFSTATDGLSLKLLNTGNDWGAVNLRDFTLTRGPVSPIMANTGINIFADPIANKACSANMSFRDLVIQGSTNGTNEWLNSMILNGIGSTSTDNVSIFGLNATSADRGDVLLAITGPNASQYAANNNIVNCTLAGGSVGLLITGYVQGVAVANSTIIGQYDSVRWTGGAGLFAEELALSNCSLNGGHRGIYTTQVNSSSITGATILHFAPGTVSGFAGIEINQGFLCSVVGNNVIGTHTGTETGIIFSDCSGQANTCAGNVTTNITGAGIWLSGTTANVAVTGNVVTGGTAPPIQQDTFGNNILGNSWNGAARQIAPDVPIAFTVAGGPRWFVGNDGTTESGSNAGNDFEIVRASDAGSILGAPLTIKRSSGIISFALPPTFAGLPVNAANDAAAAAAAVPVGGIYRNGSVLMVRVA